MYNHPYISSLLGALLFAIISMIAKIAIDKKILELIVKQPSDALIEIAPVTAVGFILGWAINIAYNIAESAKILREQSTELKKEIDELRQKKSAQSFGFFEKDPFSLMLTPSPHTGVLGTLIQKSLRKGRNRIYDIDENGYFGYLKEAVLNADTFETIHKGMPEWFKNQAGKNYIDTLRNKKMRYKRRIFVVPKAEAPNIKNVIKDASGLSSYWEMNGIDMETYLIEEEVVNSILDLQDRVLDSVFFDGHLLFRFDESKCVFHFDITEEGDYFPEARLFQKLEEQIHVGGVTPFMRLNPSGSF